MSDEPLKILIVDNHPLFLESLAGILSSDEFEVRKAAGGLEAIDMLETFKPQIFFLDLVMPYIGGEKLTQYIRSHEEFDDSFIVILSGIAKETDHVDIPDRADAFIAKGPLKNMAGHIFDTIDMYRQKKRESNPENLLGLNEISPRHVTKELLFSVKHLEVLLANMREGIIEVSGDNRIVFINPAAIELLGATEFSLLSKPMREAFANGSSGDINQIMDIFDGGGEVRDRIIRLNHRYVRASILKISDGDVEAKMIFLNDVTTFKEKEAGLQKALGEKEMLVREVHHRVKNNLNVISGLLSIQSTMVRDITARNMLLEIQPRLQSISLVHDKLYNAGDLTNIDLRQYLEELAVLLLGMMGDEEMPVRLETDIPPVSLGTDKTVSLGLICTEIITNALKYGFYRDNPEENVLTIVLSLGKDGLKKLTIGNNGHPFPDDVIPRDSKKLGFQVIKLLVNQLDGTLELNKEKGTEFSITFP